MQPNATQHEMLTVIAINSERIVSVTHGKHTYRVGQQVVYHGYSISEIVTIREIGELNRWGCREVTLDTKCGLTIYRSLGECTPVMGVSHA